jgi:hypothetical protein
MRMLLPHTVGMGDVEEHRRVLRDLVSASGDISMLARQLRRFQGWDVEPLVTLGGPDIVRVLERYLRGALSAAEVGMWADALEVRDDVDYGDDAENGVLTAMFQLANKGMGACPATPKEVRRVIAELTTPRVPELSAHIGLVGDSTSDGPHDVDEEDRFVRWASSPDGDLFEIRGATSSASSFLQGSGWRGVGRCCGGWSTYSTGLYSAINALAGRRRVLGSRSFPQVKS